MRSRDLLRKDLGELLASRAFWLLLLVIGPLAGQSFIQAVDSYAEASGIGGGPAALAQGLSPLDGVLSPTMGAFDLAIMLLFPFVAIRLVASEKSSGALKLMLQWPASRAALVASKIASLLVAWFVSLIAFAAALVLWASYGGHLDAAETLNLVFGYTLRFLMTTSIAMAAAAIMPGAANAAVVVLAFTIGTWALDFMASGRGGLLQRIASYTPTAVLRNFERGLLRIDVVLVMLIVAAAGFAITVLWLDLGTEVRKTIVRSVACVLVALGVAAAASSVRAAFDLSENRRSSFAAGDERALAEIRTPLEITVWLAGEDPRMNDFESNLLVKLRRALPHLDVRYPLEGRSGLFENDDRYGRIEYRLGARTAISRSTTEEIVLETIYKLAGLPMPPREESAYAGYPLKKHPAGAAFVFYVLWPLIVLVAWWGVRRNRQTG